jgi:hypothetical protein
MLLFFLGSSTEQNCAALAARQRAPTMAATEQIQEGRCLGRLVRNDPKGVWMLPLEEPGTGAVKNWFHIPYRCEKREIKGGLCEFCIAKERRTAEHLEAAGGGMVKRGLHSGMLHGRVGDAIPPWSRIFGGEWYNLKLGAGCTVSAETMARAKKAVVEAEGIAAATEAADAAVPLVQKPKGKPGRKPKAATETATAEQKAAGPVQTKLSIAELRKAATARASEQKAAAAEPLPSPSPAPTPAAPAPKAAPKAAPKKMAPKKAAGAALLPSIGIAEAFVEQRAESPVEDVVEIKVRRLELDGGRSYYLDSKKQKLYDMKFKYVGRYSAAEGSIDRSFPDSDQEC